MRYVLRRFSDECRECNCVHVSEVYRRRNCDVTDCSSYTGYYEERWYEEEEWEFEDSEDEK